ncbi:MAG: MDR family MFS transporter [Gammaproteobacteria bacterium]
MNLYREAFLNIKKFPKIFWVVITATLINQIGNMALVFLMLYTTQHLGFTLEQSASAFAVLSGSMLLSGILSGNLIDYFGAARVMIGAVLMNGIVLLVIPLLHNYYAIILMCLLWGLFYGAYRPASQTLISYFTTDGLHKITFSVFRLALNLGMSIGPVLGGYLATYSFSAIFISNGIANLLTCFILVSGLAGSVWLTYRPVSEQKKIFTLKWLKYDSTLRLFLIGMIPVSMVFFQHESTLAVYLKQDLGFPLSFYGWLFTINTLLIVFFELLLNVAMMNWPYRVNFILGTLFISAGFAGLYFATDMWHIILLTVFWTMGEMILYPSASSYIAEISPEGRRGSYMALFGSCSNLGMLLGPWSGAVVMQHLGSSALWIACGICGMVSIVIFCFLK